MALVDDGNRRGKDEDYEIRILISDTVVASIQPLALIDVFEQSLPFSFYPILLLAF